VMKEFLFGKSKRAAPSVLLPSRKTDLFSLSPGENVLVWFGHSSYFLQVDGKKILVDPVLSGSASPVKFTTRSFRGSDIYMPGDIPEIDYLLISHDHWDHLDYQTIVALKPKVKKVITGLGVGAHLERWGYDPSVILEKDWYEHLDAGDGFRIDAVPARHFSGRTFTRNRSLWTSFVLTAPTMKIYIGGDSGYDIHFKEIGERYGAFDLAILENGQYDKSWKYIHMMPEEVVQAAIDLKAKRLLPVHWSKFTLANHAWDEPMIRVLEAARLHRVPVLAPMIGEVVNLEEMGVEVVKWWEEVR